MLVLCCVVCRHHLIWETNKDAFFRRYGMTDRPVSLFDADIQRWACT